ncbi:hypothetical protein AK812_SmicGene13487 [Symbiodinium microadriaticum]|uniref:Uncharacterized protein n=1 Tax=Symbiodinium microadriaticum TaxID=2951 RepID=A0A1Q9E805_SYMMI|nr:hypothetical protein AK812_SmicGene13487 [Symbiodinium microadriaticum]
MTTALVERKAASKAAVDQMPAIEPFNEFVAALKKTQLGEKCSEAKKIVDSCNAIAKHSGLHPAAELVTSCKGVSNHGLGLVAAGSIELLRSSKLWTTMTCDLALGMADIAEKGPQTMTLEKRMKPSKWSSERDPVLASRDTYLRKPPPHRWAVLAEIELPKGDFLEGGVELPPKGAGPQISGRFEEERPRPEAKAVSQEIKVSFATGQPDVKVYVAETRRARHSSSAPDIDPEEL